MKLLKYYPLITIFILFTLASTLNSAQLITKQEKETIELVWDSVVRIESVNKDQFSLGTGIAVANRTIVTNYHVVQGVKTVNVIWKNKTYTGLVLYENEELDLAFISVPIHIKPVIINYKFPERRTRVFALGFPKGVPTTSIGIVTGKQFVTGYEHIESDVIMSSGNSGGPLINSYGELIGLNRAIVVDIIFYHSGLSIPGSVILKELHNIKRLRKLPITKNRGTLGIKSFVIDKLELSDGSVISVPKGIFVQTILRNSFLTKAGIKEGDIIVKLNNIRVNSMIQLIRYLDRLNPGKDVKLTVIRLSKIKGDTASFKELSFKVKLQSQM